MSIVLLFFWSPFYKKYKFIFSPKKQNKKKPKSANRLVHHFPDKLHSRFATHPLPELFPPPIGFMWYFWPDFFAFHFVIKNRPKCSLFNTIISPCHYLMIYLPIDRVNNLDTRWEVAKESSCCWGDAIIFCIFLNTWLFSFIFGWNAYLSFSI